MIRQALLLWTVLLTCAGAAFGAPTAVGADDKAGAVARPAVGAAGKQDVFPVDRRLYPYYPSLLRYTPSKAAFTAPEMCWGCHKQQYEDWRGSMHAMAYRDPVYQAELNKAVQAIGHDNARNCEGCHSPAAVVTGEIKAAGLKGLGPVAMAGVSCDVCHSVSGVSHQETPTRNPENASLILSPGRDTEKGPVLVKRGPFPPSKGCGGGFHECVESPLHLTSELCASCHQSTHFEAHSPLGSTYTEWKGSPYAQKGIHCQDCHMVDIATFRRTADSFTRPRREEYRHYFNGPNFLLYSLGEAAARKAGDQDLASSFRNQYEMAIERLRSCADLEIFPVYQNGRLAEVKVRVRNIRAGHNLPTHLTNIRQVWLEVTALDEKRKVLMVSGRIDAQGKIAPDSRMFGSEGLDAQGQPAVDPWAVRSLSRMDSIPPQGFRDVYYGIPASEGGGALTFEVRLRYRQMSQELAENILASLPADIDLEAVYGIKGIPRMPVVDMAGRKAVFASRR
jgi:nitrate/TMAO reductase-like tetraheme cytochrome c subunit